MRFQEVFPGLEATRDLPPLDRIRVIELANREFCACRCGYTEASCVNLDRHCPNRPKNLARIDQLIQEARDAAAGGPPQ